MGEGDQARADLHHRMGAAVVAAVAFAVLAWTGWGAELTSSSTPSRSASDGLVSGIFVAGAVIAAVQGRRGRDRQRTGLAVAVGALIAGQALLASLPALAGPAPHGAAVLVGLASIVLVATVLVGVALRDARRERHVADAVFAIGMGMGMLAAGHLTLLIPIASQGTAMMDALVWLVVATHAAAVVLVVGVVPRRTAELLAATATVVGSVLLLRISPLEGSTLDVLLSLALAAAGAAWLAVVWLVLARGTEDSAQPEPEIDHAALASSRDQRERLHELRSTVAGLVNSSALIEDPAVPLDVRSHMWESVRSELGRMQRLLSSQDQLASAVDLDEALSPVLDMQRSKGRTVELHTSGDQVRGRRDALAEVVNILLDNAATHGGCDTSRVEVVRRDDDTVDISVTDDGQGVPDELREHVFDWGDHREGSPGEGIGLSLARRLVSQDGGTLRLVDAPEASGSTFVISLPAARRSEENFISEDDPHVARRCPG
jgi:signal transduction histidine kinase